jgi:hypothetical protein
MRNKNIFVLIIILILLVSYYLFQPVNIVLDYYNSVNQNTSVPFYFQDNEHPHVGRESEILIIKSNRFEGLLTIFNRDIKSIHISTPEKPVSTTFDV